MSTDTKITIDGYTAGKTYTITYLKYDDAATTTGGKNYYRHIYLRGYTKARYNTLRPVTVKTTMKLVFDICGWENVTEPTVPDTGQSEIVLIPEKTTYYVEIWTNRSISWTFTDYTTDSTKWQTGFPVSTDFTNASLYTAGEPQCDIVGYSLWIKDSGGNYLAYSAELNTETEASMASKRADHYGDYKKSLRTWDESTRTFTIDTADNTTQLGTETFYILMTTRGNK